MLTSKFLAAALYVDRRHYAANRQRTALPMEGNETLVGRVNRNILIDVIWARTAMGSLTETGDRSKIAVRLDSDPGCSMVPCI